jgi:hypothetical protein
LVYANKIASIEKGMKRYVLANIKIPIIVNEDGLFDMLNEYTQTEITSLNQLPTIEEEDNLYKKIMDFLSKKDDDLEEEPVQKIKIKDNIDDTEETSKGSDSCEATKATAQEETKEKVEHVLTICKNNIKMRKHSDNMTFKNIKKGAKSYTRKTYL